jgi:mxaC protein
MQLLLERPYLLLLLPLAALPWLSGAQRAEPSPWVGVLPTDAWSERLALTLKLLASGAIAACLCAMAAPALLEPARLHVGRGAQIIFVLDRSLSMDQSFVGRPASSGATGVDAASGGESKNSAARRLLSEFARRRTHDLMALLAFTTVPIAVSGFTDRQEVIQSAIAAGGVGHGVADTDVARGLIAALGMFHEQPYNGSRVILLVSDGGAHLDLAAQRHITELMKQERVALYWLYLRTRRSPGLMADREVSDAEAELVPEHFLHRYFASMGAPYHAYEAENPDSLEQAIADVDRLQSQPIRYQSPTVPRDLAPAAYLTALLLTALLCLASLGRVRAR